MPNVGPMELIIVLVIALLVLGPKKLPDVGRSVGKGMREFKDAIGGGGNDDAIDTSHFTSAPAPQPVQAAPAPVVAQPAPVQAAAAHHAEPAA